MSPTPSSPSPSIPVTPHSRSRPRSSRPESPGTPVLSDDNGPEICDAVSPTPVKRIKPSESAPHKLDDRAALKSHILQLQNQVDEVYAHLESLTSNVREISHSLTSLSTLLNEKHDK